MGLLTLVDWIVPAGARLAAYMPAVSQPPLVPRMKLRMLEVGGSAWDYYSEALATQPLLTKSLTACVLVSGADCAAQAIEGKGIELARVLRFGIFGLVLQAPWNHFYYLLLDGAIPPTSDPLSPTNLAKVGITSLSRHLCSPPSFS